MMGGAGVLVPLLLLLLLLVTIHNAQGQFSVAPADVTVNETDSAIITCSHPNATSISWRKDGVTIDEVDMMEDFNISSSMEGESWIIIDSASFELHNGSYSCVAELEDGGADVAPFSITVQYIGTVSVEVEVECEEEHLYVGSDVALRCVVSASLPATISSVKWLRVQDSTPILITEGDNRRYSFAGMDLMIANVTSNETAYFYCRVSNGPLEVESDRVSLNVRTSPPSPQLHIEYDNEVLTEGDTILVKENSPVRITCSLTPSYLNIRPSDVSWTRNTAGISSGNTQQLFAQGACNNYILLITQTTTTHEGFYNCRIKLASGTLTVRFTLDLATIPQDYTVTMTPPDTPLLGVGMAVSFLCEADPGQSPGNVEVVYSWEFIPEGGGVAVEVVGDGSRVMVDGSSLSITRLEVGESGKFVCLAGNTLVAPVNASISLTVEAAFEVSVAPAVPVVKLGTRLLLTCTTESPRPADFTWDINGSPVTSSDRSDRFVVETYPFMSTLLITSLVETDLTSITCTASDPLHLPINASVVAVETGQLYLFGDRTEETLYVGEGVELRLVCPIRSRSDSTAVKWFFGKLELRDGVEGVELQTSANGNAVAILGNVSLDDHMKKYDCIVTDGGIRLQYNITVFVTIPPSFSRFPTSITNATVGTRLQLDCFVSGRPPPKVNWFKMSTNVSELANLSIVDLGNGSLVFESVSQEHEGHYFCVIRDPLDTRGTTVVVLDDSGGSGGVPGLTQGETILIFGLASFFTVVLIVLGILFCCLCVKRLSQNGKYFVNRHGFYDTGSLKQNSLQGSRGKPSSDVSTGNSKPEFNTFAQSPPKVYDDESYGPGTTMPLNTFSMGDVSMTTASHTSNSPSHAHMSFPPHGTAVTTPSHVPMSYPPHGTAVTTPSHAYPPHGTAVTTPSHVPMSYPPHGTAVTTPSHVPMSYPPHGTAVTTPSHDSMGSTSLFTTDDHSTYNGLPNFPRINVKLEELMGQGEFGPVMKGVARNLVAGQVETEVAVKLLVSEDVEDTGFQADLAMADYANHMKLRYRNIVSILGICSDNEPFYVMYEYLDRGDLKNFLLNSNPEQGATPMLMDHELMHMIGQVADGMAYLLSQRIIHGDIATRNCLVSSSLQVKIGDLGIGHELYTGDYYDNGAQLLPIRWMPPELLTDSEEGPSFSLHSDTWSFGVFCWEVMAYARLPYENYSDEEVLAMIPGGSRLRSPSKSCPPQLYLVMMDCWNETPELRPEFTKIMSSLANINLEV